MIAASRQWRAGPRPSIYRAVEIGVASRQSFWDRTHPAAGGLLAAIAVAHLLVSLASPAVQNEIFYRFAVIPLRFEVESPDHFASPWEALGPLLGHVFLHGGWLHLGMNAIAFLQAAPFVAWRMGTFRFLSLFFLSAAGGAIAYVLIQPRSDVAAVGASGAICGVFGAYFLAVRPSVSAALADPAIRNAISSFLLINVVLMGVLSFAGVLPIAWEAHLGGFLTGAACYPALARRAPTGPWA